MEFVEIVQTYLNFIKSCRDDLTFGTDFWNLKISVDKKKNCSLKEKNICKQDHRHRSTPKVEWTLPFKCIQKLHSSDIKNPSRRAGFFFTTYETKEHFPIIIKISARLRCLFIITVIRFFCYLSFCYCHQKLFDFFFFKILNVILCVIWFLYVFKDFTTFAYQK